MLDDLKPNTEYEFTVKIVRGRRQSPWSLVVVNKTRESAPSSPPRDLTIHPASSGVQNNDLTASITLNWRPPKTPNGKVNGYLIQVSMTKILLVNVSGFHRIE
jgi:neogenin